MEWLAVSIGIGLIVSLLFTEAFGLSVGGMIVPGYLAIYLDQPLTVGLTILAALATWGCIRILNRWAILFGRRRVVLTMVIGFAVAALARSALTLINDPLPLDDSVVVGMTVIGFVIPGLIALWIDRTGIVQTLSPLVIASCLVKLVLLVLGMEAIA
jgi:poly-gamma-glutamate biosynthesis protein PgsC/CapC